MAGYSDDLLMVRVLILLVVLLAFCAAVAVASAVILRGVRRSRDIATRRVLGATRTQIATALVSEAAGWVLFGLILGSAVILFLVPRDVGILLAFVSIALAGLLGAWVGARRVASLPLGKSGLFRAAPDRREDFNSF